jgi:hypothetical protein
MQPKSDEFVLSRNEGLSMDKKDNDGSTIKHDDGSNSARIEDVLQV